MDENTDSMSEYLKDVVIGDAELSPIVVRDYDPEWPSRFEDEKEKVIFALGEVALRVEHIGSTSVPGLAAKPIVDMLLVVEDSSDERSYLPQLERAGYVLRVREPGFDGHRMLRTPEKDVHLHVFSQGSVEVTRYLLLRDRLRSHPKERALYTRTKRELSGLSWPTMNHYAEAKTAVIKGIISRAAGETDTDPARLSRD